MDTEKKIKKLLQVIRKIGIDSQDPRILSIIEDLLDQDTQVISFETPSKTWLVGDEVWWWNKPLNVLQWGKIKEFDGDTATIWCNKRLVYVPVRDLGALVGDNNAKCGDVTFTRGDEVKPNWCGWGDRRMWCLDFIGEKDCKVIIASPLSGIYTSKEPLNSLEKLGGPDVS